jgi:hypothetical protein
MKKFITNPVYHDLKMLKLIDDKNIILINKQTRDKNIRVLQDKKTRVIFLEKFTRLSNYYKKEKGSTRYKQKSMTHLKDGTILKTSKVSYKNKKVSAKYNIVGDDLRRFDQFKKYGSRLETFGLLSSRGFWQLLLDKDGNPASKPPWGGIAKIDLVSGKKIWSIPFGARLDKYKNVIANGDKNFGGVLTTAGNLLFATGLSSNSKAFL